VQQMLDNKKLAMIKQTLYFFILQQFSQ